MRKRLFQPEKLLWRRGRTVGRTIYAVVGAMPGDGDILIGVMDTAKLAEACVHGHNLLMVKHTADRQPKEIP